MLQSGWHESTARLLNKLCQTLVGSWHIYSHALKARPQHQWYLTHPNMVGTGTPSYKLTCLRLHMFKIVRKQLSRKWDCVYRKRDDVCSNFRPPNAVHVSRHTRMLPNICETFDDYISKWISPTRSAVILGLSCFQLAGYTSSMGQG